MPSADGGLCDVPGDLPAFLDGCDEGDPNLGMKLAKQYKSGACRTVGDLLAVAEADLRMVPGLGPVVGPRVARHIRTRWRVEPGCLAQRAPDPKSRTDAATVGLGAFLSRHRSAP